jgi:para-nitrobenzyl esterase
LYLNVSAPVGTTAADRLPVMVHLHGGGNYFGGSYRNADTFTERGVIVVTVGYRLGVLGFAGHPQLTQEGDGSSGEYGVLDQVAALRWVQDNIGGFGGDPDNVTLFGESAGSFDAVAIAASPLGEGLLARVAPQTEAFGPLHGKATIADAEEIGAAVAAAVGCAKADDVLACLRALPAEDLVEAAGRNDVWPWVGGKVLSASPLELIRSDATPVPMLLGSNREETANWFAPETFPPGDNYTTNWRYRDTNWLVGPQRGHEVRDIYPVEDYENAFWATTAALSDGVYTCPMRRLALANNAPVYRYLYTHVYDDTVPEFWPPLGRAAHFYDEPILWNDPVLLLGYDWEFSAHEKVLAVRMADYWTNFAKTGNPNGPAGVDPWPAFTATSENIKVLDEPTTGDLVGYHNAQCEYFDQLNELLVHPVEFTPLMVGPR